MRTRRHFLEQTVRGSSLLAVGPLVPEFLAASARAAEPGGETVLVVLELTGGNDGLNTVVPFADDLYHKARPTLRLAAEKVVKVDDRIGLNPGLRGLEKLLAADQLAIVQGVGYPNPDRSHFESMDVWQTADPARRTADGWLGRSLGVIPVRPGQVPGVHVGAEALPRALRGSAAGLPTIHPSKPFDLELVPSTAPARGAPENPLLIAAAGENPGRISSEDARYAPRRRLIEDLAERTPTGDPMLRFVRRTSLQTYAAIEHLREFTGPKRRPPDTAFGSRNSAGGLGADLNLVARLIASEFGTRLFYVALSGFDTHANQLRGHQQLLEQLAGATAGFFAQLEHSGHARRVVLMTFSEFGRRVHENGSRGTDHGAASCLFVAGPAVQGGVLGAHPSLSPNELDAGDLKHHTDFRRVYATLLDGWLGCPSAEVLGAPFEPLPLLRKNWAV